MVSYDSYKNRIAKIAAVKNFIVRFRILFITVISLILAAVTALLVMRGMVVGGLTLPAEIYYGDTFEAEGAKVIMGSYTLEYANADGAPREGKVAAGYTLAADEGELVWTDKKPDRAGNYYVRTVTKRSFGIKGYGSPVKFEIQPKEVQFVISSESVVYGENPDEYIFPLVGSDKLIVTGLKFSFDGFETNITDVCANADTVKIVDGKGEDVTYCYNIVTPKTEVKLVERKITASPQTAEFIFDGSPIDFESVVSERTQSMLGSGDRAEISVTFMDVDGNVLEGNPVYAGDYTAEISQIAIFNGETDVTERYGIELEPCAVKVGKRDITVKTNSAEREYDGTPLADHGFTFEGLAEGHTLKADGDEISITDVGTAVNEYSFRIFGGEEDLTENYSISYDYGTLSVIKKQVTLTTLSAERVYDGMPLAATEGYVLSALAEGDTESIATFAERVQAGESENEITFTISNADGEDVTYNYNFTNTFGALKVTPRPLTVTTGSVEKVYDGEVIYGGDALPDFDNLVTGHTYAVSEQFTLKDAGEESNTTTYSVFFEGEDVTENYGITYVFGTFKIAKREVSVTTYDNFWEYDGYQKRNEQTITFTYNDGNDGLVAGHSYNVTEYAYVKDVCENVENRCVVEIFDPDGEDVAGNYSIVSYTYGKLNVAPRALTVTTGSAQREYDGTPFVYTEGAEGDNLAEGHRLEADGSRSAEFTSVTDVAEGNVENFAYFIVVDGEGNEVTANYDITYVQGIIGITPREITVTTVSHEWEYDGEVHFDKTATAREGDLVLNHEIIILSKTEITDAGSAENALYCIVTDEQVNVNYHITYANGLLTVLPREITITTASHSWTYDGEVKFDESATEEEGDLVLNHTIVVNAHTEITDAGETQNILDCVIENELINGNYSITYSNGTLTVTPREIVITTYSDTWEYDGQAHSYAAGMTRAGDLVLDHFVNVLEYTEITDAGEAENVLSCIITDEQITKNYNIAYENGTLTVTPREVTIVTRTASWEYDGEEHSDNYVQDMRADGDFGFVPFIHEIRFDTSEGKTWATICNVGEVTNEVIFEVVDVETGESVGHNYRLTYDYGTLTVIPREIVVTTATNTWEYDGEVHFDESAAARDGDLVLNHEIVVKSHTEITNAGTAENVLGCIVTDEQVNKNYHITYENGTLTVTRREIEITTATTTWEYDGEVHYDTGYEIKHVASGGEKPALVLTHKSRVVAYESITETGEAQNILDIVIYDDEVAGVDVNYSVKLIYGTLKITPREIVITTATHAWEYDGEVYFDESATAREGDLVLEHEIVVKSHTEITNAGTAENALDCIVTDERVNANYHITYSNGVLTVAPREITVTTATNTWEYDGEVHFDKGVTVTRADGSFTLAEGHALIVGTYTEIQNAGEKENVLGCIISDEETDKNYHITYVNGVLKVTPRPVTVTTLDETWVYDGKEHASIGVNISYTGSTEDGLVSEMHIPILKDKATIIDAGSKQNFCLVDKITDGKITDYTANYRIVEYVYGTLTVTKRPLTINTGSADKIYDGAALLGDRTTAKAQFSNIAEGETPLENTVSQITDVIRNADGTIGSILNETTYRIFRGTVESTANYDITYLNGTLRINPRPIKITTATAEKDYDGTPLRGDEGNGIIFDGQVMGENPVPVQIKEIAEVAFDENGNVTSVPNQTTYKILRGQKDTTANYDITYGYGTLKINPRKITVTTATNKWIYDGIVRFDEGVEISEGSLVSGHKLIVSAHTDIQNAGEKQNALTCIVESESITRNYSIAYVNGKLTVTPRVIVLTPASHTWEYDGEVHFDDGVTAREGDLVLGHKIVVKWHTEITDVGEKGNMLGCIIEDEEITENYSISYYSSKLTVTKKALSITNGPLTKVYDGTPLKGNGVAPEIAGLVSGEAYRAYNVAEITAAGSVPNDTTYKFFADRNGVEFETTANYNITYAEGGALTITKRQLKVTTASASHEFDGKSFSTPDGYSADNLAPDQSLKLIEGASIQFVGELENKITFDVVDKAGNAVTINYDPIEYEYGKLTVTPREITVTTATDSWEYDGEAHSNDNSVPSRADGGAALAFDYHKLVAQNSVTVTDAGSVTNAITYKVVNANTQGDVSVNYSIKYVNGTLTVTPRKITVSTGSDKREYNGEALTKQGGTADRLVTGHTLAAQESWKSQLNVGKIENSNTFKVLNGAADVTGNYQITPAYGTLEVLPKQVGVILNAMPDLVYGDAFTAYAVAPDNYANVRTAGMVSSEKLTVAVYYTQSGVRLTADPKDAGTYYVCVDEENCAVTGGLLSNYKINQAEQSSFEITKRPLKVTLKQFDGKEYDGTAHLFPGDNFELNTVGAQTVYDEVLTVGVTYVNGRGTTVAQPKDAGVYTVKLDPANCLIDGKSAGLKNYDISAENTVSFEITKRKLTVTLEDVTRVYDGKFFDYIAEKREVTVERILDGDAFIPVIAYDGSTVLVRYAGEYKISISGWTVSGNKTENYQLVNEPESKLTIQKRNITVSVMFGDTNVYEVQYRSAVIPDGEMRYTSVFNGEGGGAGFVDGDDKKSTPAYTFTQGGVEAEPKARGTYDVAISFAGNPLIDDNYSVTYVGGTLKIINRKVTVEVKDILKSLEYDGKPYSGEFDKYINYHTVSEQSPDDGIAAGFLDGDENNYTAVYTVRYADGAEYNRNGIIYAGIYSVTVRLVIKDGFTEGYEISYAAGKSFSVAKRLISVKAAPDISELTYSKVVPDISGYTYEVVRAKGYGGEAFVNADGEKVTGVQFGFTAGGIAAQPVNAGDYGVRVTYIESDGDFIANNYSIVYDAELYGKLTINRRRLVIKAQNQSTQYNGKPFSLSEDGYVILEGALMAGDILTVKGNKSLAPNLPATPVTIGSYKISDGGNDMTGNYEVITGYIAGLDGYNAGSFAAALKFTARTVKIRQILPSTYAGYTYTGSSISVSLPAGFTPYALVEGELLSGERFTVLNTLLGINAGTYAKWLNLGVINANGAQISWAYNIQVETDESTSVTISRRAVSVIVTADTSGYQVGDVLASGDYTITNGSLIGSDRLVITVTEQGFDVQVVQRLSADASLNKTNNYSVTVTL